MTCKLRCNKCHAASARTQPLCRRRLRGAVCRMTACALLASVVLGGCARNPSEDALRDQLQAAQAAIESRDAAALVDVLADDFVGPDGLDRDGVRRMATLQWMQHARVGATIAAIDIKLQDDHATVALRAALTGAAQQSLPDSAQVYSVQTGWRFSEGQWRMTSATWTPGL